MRADNIFMAKVHKCHSTGCWLWKGYLDGGGYGQLIRRRHGKRIHHRAHRYSYELYNGTIPDGLFVLHKCDVPICVNPEHLFLGTQSDNMKDCVAKGRISYVDRRTHSKLTDEDVTFIRMFLNLGAKTRNIANAYGVTRATVYSIKNGKRLGGKWTQLINC